MSFNAAIAAAPANVPVKGNDNGNADGITLDDIDFGYGDFRVLEKLSLTIQPGEFFTLIGPSGCGKTTILRLVAGLMTPNRGRILIGDRDVTDVPTHKRGIGLVFQNYALFPHMTVAENVAYGLRMQGASREQQREAVVSALQMVGMQGVEARFPGELSGGQQQRIGIARAVAARPRVMLLDEPLSNLDAKLREQMCIDIADLQRRLRITVLYVTHDQGEALAMSDRIAIMNKGRIHELGTPQAIYDRPSTLVGAGFLGNMNMLTLNQGDGWRTPGGAALQLAEAPQRNSVTAIVRPEAVQLSAASGGIDKVNDFSGVVTKRVYRGVFDELLVETAGFDAPLQALVMARDGYTVGQAVSVHIDTNDIHVLDEDAGQ